MGLIDAQAVRYAVCNVDIPACVTEEQFAAVLGNVCEALQMLPTIDAVPLDALCALLAKNADCPPEHSPVQDHCKENCAECWKSVLKEWMEEDNANQT